MMSSQESIIDKMHTMQLPIQSQHSLSCLCNLQKHTLFILPQLNIMYAWAIDLFTGIVFSLEHLRHTQTLSVEHNHALPVIKLEELD